MIELKFPKKVGEITFPITKDYMRLAKDVGVPPQLLPNVAFALLDAWKDIPGVKDTIEKVRKKMMTNPIPEEPLTKS